MDMSSDLSEVGMLINRASALAKRLEGAACTFRSDRLADVDEFSAKVQALRLKHEFWTSYSENRAGMMSVTVNSMDIGSTALAALKEIEAEEPRVRRFSQPFSIRGCMSIKTRCNFDFPLHLIESLQRVIDVFDNLPKVSQGSRRSSTSFFDVMPSKVRQSKLPFGAEKRYIPLRRSATRIRRVLENQHGPQVVVLHGGCGTGKSSLARYLAMRYQEGDTHAAATAAAMAKLEENTADFDFELRDADAVLTSQTSSTSRLSRSENVLYGNCFPGGVFYVPCIQGSRIVDKQLQLLQDLGFTPPIGKLSHLSLDEIHNRLQKKLTEYLGRRDALVIIDNVWDPSILRWLLIRGSKVKYLVTTQDARFCEEEDCDSISIGIERLSLDTARKILASDTTSVDSDSQNVLDAIINLTMANPLALMNVAMTVLRANDLEEWKDVRNNLEALNLLSSLDESAMGFPREIPQIICCSMMLALEYSLPLGVEKLLVILAALEGPSVPQVVVQLLAKTTQGNLISFSRCRNFLEDRGLIRLHTQTVWWSNVPQTTWYIDAPLQRFIQVSKAKPLATIVDSLLNNCGSDSSEGFDESDYTLTVALCAVYGSPRLAEKAAMKLGAFSYSNELARIWAAPIVSSFQVHEPHSDDEKWKIEIHSHARQVFLSYIYDENPDKGMKGLLAAPMACGPICWSIAWAVPNQKRALFARSGETLQGLVKLICKSVHSDLRECAAAALWNLSMAAETKVIVARSPGLLDEVVLLLDGGIGETLQRHAAGILASLASEKDNQEDLVAFPGLVQGLVALLRNYSSSNVQVYAAHALLHLSSEESNRMCIAKFPGALERLVELMDGTVCVHEIAVGAIMHLSMAPDNKPIIAKFPGALDTLVRLMTDSASVIAQKRAAAALVSLTTDSFLAIRLFPGVLEKLVGLLSKVGRPEVQEVAVKILANLAVTDENAGTIANFPGAWRGLLRLLRKEVVLEVQGQALDTLGLLAAAGQSRVARSGVAVALETLLGLIVYNHANFQVLKKVLVAIFRILDTGDGKNFVAISKFPGSIHQLISLLGQFECPELQEAAAMVLATLAKWKQNRVAISNFPLALDGLVELLTKDAKPSVQVVALKTLWHVAHGEDQNRRMIAEYPGCLRKIVALLERDVLPGVQVCASLVISTVAGVEGKNYVGPEETPNLLNKLDALLATSSPSVQQEAAKTRTLLDWEGTNLLSFDSSDAYAGRGRANGQLGMLRQALADFDVAVQTMWDMDFTLQRDRLDDEFRCMPDNDSPSITDPHERELDNLHGKIAHVLSNRAYVKAVLTDYSGALGDADSALELQPRDNLLWQERGVLKRLMGDLPGALVDLEASLQIVPDDYESLKHCGYVCYLLENPKAACTIAERALEIDLDQGYDPPDGDEYCRLGKLSVSYLDFNLP